MSELELKRLNEFKGNYVFSILKKGRIRENRINRDFESKMKFIVSFTKY